MCAPCAPAPSLPKQGIITFLKSASEHQEEAYLGSASSCGSTSPFPAAPSHPPPWPSAPPLRGCPPAHAHAAPCCFHHSLLLPATEDSSPAPMASPRPGTPAASGNNAASTGAPPAQFPTRLPPAGPPLGPLLVR
eukprot:1160287-Pelagomonas_calceolata.AAC.9